MKSVAHQSADIVLAMVPEERREEAEKMLGLALFSAFQKGCSAQSRYNHDYDRWMRNGMRGPTPTSVENPWRF